MCELRQDHGARKRNDSYGLYRDTYRKTDEEGFGGWRFATRWYRSMARYPVRRGLPPRPLARQAEAGRSAIQRSSDVEAGLLVERVGRRRWRGGRGAASPPLGPSSSAASSSARATPRLAGGGATHRFTM